MKIVNGERLYRARRRAGFTQGDLSALVKRSQQYISQLENGRESTCSEQVAVNICRYLGVELEDVFAYPDPENTPRTTSVSAATKRDIDRVKTRGTPRPPVRPRTEGAA